jgi:hypothetical protein
MFVTEDPSRRRTLLIALSFVVIYLLQILLAVGHQSQTNDEGYHLAAGYRYWQCGDFGINPEHPPLVKLLAAVPLRLLHVPAPDGACGKEPTTKDAGYGMSYHWYYEQGLDPERMMRWGRIAAATFSLMLAVTSFFFARALFGSAAALFTLALLVFEPTLLAHGALITTDSAVTACMILSVFAFYSYAQQPTFVRLLLAGISIGLTLAVKHSGVLLLPILLLLAIAEAWQRRDTGRARLRPLLAYMAIVTIGVAVLWTVYDWRFAPRPGGVAMTLPLAQFISNVEQQGNDSFLVAQAIPLIARLHLLPEAYLYGFVDVLSISHPGQPPFLLGKLYPHGQWFYFPITFMIKSTLGFLALGLCVVLVPWRRLAGGRPLLYVLTPCTVVLGAAMTSGLNIGYRHVLPMVPFLCVLLGATAAWMLSRKGALRVTAIILSLVHIASSLLTFPDYIPYSNEAWGGPSRTYRVLTDANADWGQSIKELKTYLDRHSINDCWLAYDGVTAPEYYGVHCRRLPPNGYGAPGGPTPKMVSGTLLISAMTISGIEWENAELNPYRAFLTDTPTDVVGGSILVFQGAYDMTGVAAVQHIAIANRLAGERQFAEAKTEAQSGLALMPASVRGYLALGNACAGLQQTASARQAFESALHLGQAMPAWYPNEIARAQRGLQALLGVESSGAPTS